MDHSSNSHLKGANRVVEWVWYSGTDALYQGEAVCYNTDYGTATAADASRCNRVERPTTSNNTAFAGVAARTYSAKTTGQFIELNCPGSKSVPVALGVNTVINTSIITFAVSSFYDIGVEGGDGTDGGRFYSGLYVGRGSAVPRQTVTAVLESGMTGAWSLDIAGTDLTVTSTTGLAAGDTVVLLGGQDDGTDTVVPGKYTISAVPDETSITLSTSANTAAAASALTCTGYAYTGNPTAICDLLDGEESGGIEFLNLPDGGTGAMPYMVKGKSYICGGITLGAADVDVDLAQGVDPGDKKAFILLGDLGTNDFTVDLVTNGIRLDGSTALTDILTIDDATDGVLLEFHGSRWFTYDLRVGATEA